MPSGFKNVFKVLSFFFDVSKLSNKAELAKIEASGSFSKISEIKSWINDTLWYLDNARYLSGNDTLQAWQFEVKSDLFDDQCEQIVMHKEDIADIYAKHKVTALFKPINDDIENYLKVKRDELSDFALSVDMPVADEYSFQCAVNQVTTNAVVSPLGKLGNTAADVTLQSDPVKTADAPSRAS